MKLHGSKLGLYCVNGPDYAGQESRFAMVCLQLDLPPGLSADEARLLLAIKLLEDHRVSLGKAAEMAGYSKTAFIEVIGKRGVPVFDFEKGDLGKEIGM